ncbi:MAG: carboxypeptidase-like regulatory domain-containing protein [Bacteroides sp.]|nr:carboxypeptidase-like regulatory domain-containing protein [Bacteroides sp.]
MNTRTRLKLLTRVMLLFFLSTMPALAQDNRVTINLTNASLREVFTAIEKQTPYRFSYRDVVIDSLENITISKNNATVSFILDEVLINRDLEYSFVSSRSIVISDKRKIPESNTTKQISGVVKDETGEPIMGVNVTVKGSSIGSITDFDGNFSFEAPVDGELLVSYVGYIPQEISLRGRNSFSILLKEDHQLLEELVVVGYGSMRKKDLTGSIVQIRPDKLANEKPNTVEDILRGVPGLNVGMSNTAKVIQTWKFADNVPFIQRDRTMLP